VTLLAHLQLNRLLCCSVGYQHQFIIIIIILQYNANVYIQGVMERDEEDDRRDVI